MEKQNKFNFITIPYFYNDIGFLKNKKSPSLFTNMDTVTIRIPNVEELETKDIASFERVLFVRDTVSENSVTINTFKTHQYKLFKDDVYVSLFQDVDENLYNGSFKKNSISLEDLNDVFDKQILAAKNNAKSKEYLNQLNKYLYKNLGYSIDICDTLNFDGKQNKNGIFTLEDLDKQVANTYFKLNEINFNSILDKKDIIKYIKNKYENLINVDGILYQKTKSPLFLVDQSSDFSIYPNMENFNNKINGSLSNFFSETGGELIDISKISEIFNIYQNYHNIQDIRDFSFYNLQDIVDKNFKYLNKDKKGNDLLFYFFTKNGCSFPSRYSSQKKDSISLKNKNTKFFLDDLLQIREEELHHDHIIHYPEAIFKVDENYLDYLTKSDFDVNLYAVLIDLRKITLEISNNLSMFTYDFIGNQIKKLNEQFYELIKNNNYLSSDFLEKTLNIIDNFSVDLKDGFHGLQNQAVDLSYEEIKETFYLNKYKNPHRLDYESNITLSNLPYYEIKKPGIKNPLKLEEIFLERWQKKLENIKKILVCIVDKEPKVELYENFKR